MKFSERTYNLTPENQKTLSKTSYNLTNMSIDNVLAVTNHYKDLDKDPTDDHRARR